jgi:hypothetical protein
MLYNKLHKTWYNQRKCVIYNKPFVDMLCNQIRMYMLYNHAQKDMLSCSTIWNMMHDMLHCDMIPMNKGLWGYSVSIFEDEGRGRSSACSASPSPRAVRVWRPPVGHPPLTTSTQGKVASRPVQTAASKR